MVSMVNGETATGVKVPISMPMEDIALSTFGNLVERVDGDWEKEHNDQATELVQQKNIYKHNQN